jgi:hypothetical protein
VTGVSPGGVPDVYAGDDEDDDLDLEDVAEQEYDFVINCAADQN